MFVCLMSKRWITHLNEQIEVGDILVSYNVTPDTLPIE